MFSSAMTRSSLQAATPPQPHVEKLSCFQTKTLQIGSYQIMISYDSDRPMVRPIAAIVSSKDHPTTHIDSDWTFVQKLKL